MNSEIDKLTSKFHEAVRQLSSESYLCKNEASPLNMENTQMWLPYI